jgi:hypothetical protein
MVLEDGDLEMLARAYDRAWERFLRAGMLTPQNLYASREILAKTILAAARAGVSDEWKLARVAFEALVRSDLPGKPVSARRLSRTRPAPPRRLQRRSPLRLRRGGAQRDRISRQVSD